MQVSEALKQRIARGLMAFPATPFFSDGGLDLAGLQTHVASLARHDPTALVAAGGAGEIFSLSLEEHAQVVRATVESAAGVPVIGGAGYGTSIAITMCRAVEAAGGDAVLLLPPYLVHSEQEGLFMHIRSVANAVSIPIIPYSRDNAVIDTDTMLRLADCCPNIIALKDGTSEVSRAYDLKRRAGDRLAIINGAPTAEMFALDYQSVDVNSYSSAVFTFAPLLAMRFLRALQENDHFVATQILEEFYVPLVAIRDRKRGFAVSIIKAGLRAVGAPAGPVRAPLVDLDAEEDAALMALLAKADQWLP